MKWRPIHFRCILHLNFPKIKIPRKTSWDVWPVPQTCLVNLRFFFFSTRPALNFLLLWLNLSIFVKSVYPFDIILPLMYWRSRHYSRWEFQGIPLLHITLKLKNSWETAETTCLSMLDQRAYAISWHCSLIQKSSTIFYWQQTRYLLLLYY